MTHAEMRAARIARAEVMAADYRAGFTLQAIGDKHGITRERVRQLMAEIGVTRVDRPKVATDHYWATREDSTRERIARKYSISLEQYTELREKYGPHSGYRSPIHRFRSQRNNAKKRGIGWEFTFPQWWDVWQRSGKWDMCGRGTGYCMARKGDVGPYRADNVYICTIGQNFSDSYNIDHPRRKRARRLPVKAVAYDVVGGRRWSVKLPQPIDGRKYFGGFTSKEEAEQHGLALLRAA
jgi:hypothetical protein